MVVTIGIAQTRLENNTVFLNYFVISNRNTSSPDS